MSRTKYIQAYDGEVRIYEKEKFNLIRDKDNKKIKINGYNIKTCCCDCSLVHDEYLWIEKNKLYRVPFRDKRATGQRRRYNNFPLKY